MKHLLLSGDTGIGKSTLIAKSLAAWQGPLAGYHTCRVLQGGRHIGFALHAVSAGTALPVQEDYHDGLEACIFFDRRKGQPFQSETYWSLLAQALAPAKDNPNALLLLDEIGGLELLNDGHWRDLLPWLDRNPALGVFKGESHAARLAGDADTLLRQRRRALLRHIDGEIITLTAQNRQEIEATMYAFILSQRERILP